MLQEHCADALLRAADEFAPFECDFVLRRAGKTGRGEFFAARRGLCLAAGFKGCINTKRANTRQKALADFAVGFVDIAPHHGIVGRADNAVGQFVPVQDSASTGGTADNVDTALANFLGIDFATDALCIPKGDRGRLPPVNAKGRPSTCCDRAHEGFIYCHIKKGVSLLGIQETPCGWIAFCHG